MKIKMSEKINLIFSLLVTIATLFNILLWVESKETLNNSKEELIQIKKQAQGNFIMELTRDVYFNERLFNVRKAIEDKNPIFIENGGTFAIQDIDDYIGMFETISGLVERDIVDKELVEENFGYYITDAYNNSEIYNYILKTREQIRNKELYSGFEQLAKDYSAE